MTRHRFSTVTLLALSLAMIATGVHVAGASSTSSYDINTLAGKVASVNAANGLHFGVSGFLQQEADLTEPVSTTNDPITPTYVPNSNLDNTTVAAPDVTVNQDSSGAPQNEPTVAVDPNNPNRIVVGANDFAVVTWTCFIGTTPCSAFGQGYSGTYFSTDGGATWCCKATNPSNLGTLIPGVERLTGGQYDVGGDPALAFNSQGNVYYAGLGFDIATPPNTVTVSKGTFDSGGTLHWGPPAFIGQTTSRAILNDKEWIGVDSHSSSPFRDNVYVSWTRFVFDPTNGRYVQSPIFFTRSTDGGNTFANPQLIGGPIIYDQGSRVVVGADGTVYVFWEGSTRLASFNRIWMVKSTNGGVTFTDPVAVAPLVDIPRPFNTQFRINSYPAADISPDGTLYVAWSSEANNLATSYATDPVCAFFISGTATTYANCHSVAVWSKSTDGGVTWSAPVPIFPALDASDRVAIGYPQGTLNAPAPRRVETFFPGVAISTGHVYMSAYAADIVSPWQACALLQSSINCVQLDGYTNNARLDYVVTDLTTAITKIVTREHVNTRYQFQGGFFFGDYTGIAVGSDNKFHAVWADTNNVQTFVWWVGAQYVPTLEHQQDIVTDADSF